MKVCLVGAVCVASALQLTAPDVFAWDEYPERALRFIVPFPAGASNDIFARIIGRQLTESMGRPVIIDNRPGASGLLAADIVAKAAPDGYTIMIHSASLTTSVAIQPKVPFDPFKDFAPLTQLAVAPLLMVVNANSPAKTMQELVALARNKPGSLNYGSSGIGSVLHLGTEVLNRMARIETVHVAFKGGAPAVVALVGGQIQMLLTPVPDVNPQIKAGRLRALAVSAARRTSFMPDVPTFAESGLPDFAVTQWFGLFATGGTPPAVVQRLNQEVGKTLQSQELLDRFADAGAERVASTPEAFARLVRDEIGFWRNIVREAGIKPE